MKARGENSSSLASTVPGWGQHFCWEHTEIVQDEMAADFSALPRVALPCHKSGCTTGPLELGAGHSTTGPPPQQKSDLWKKREKTSCSGEAAPGVRKEGPTPAVPNLKPLWQAALLQVRLKQLPGCPLPYVLPPNLPPWLPALSSLGVPFTGPFTLMPRPPR